MNFGLGKNSFPGICWRECPSFWLANGWGLPMQLRLSRFLQVFLFSCDWLSQVSAYLSNQQWIALKQVSQQGRILHSLEVMSHDPAIQILWLKPSCSYYLWTKGENSIYSQGPKKLWWQQGSDKVSGPGSWSWQMTLLNPMENGRRVSQILTRLANDTVI